MHRRGGKIGELVNFFTKSPKLIPPNTRAHARIIVHNGVACVANAFSKLKFAYNNFRPIRQL